MHRGYIAIWRKIQDHEFYREKRVFSKYEAWIDILMESQHSYEPQKVMLGMKILYCNYGESLKSMKTWGRRWGWGKTKVKRFLDLLQRMNQIVYANETITTRIKVINYESYDPKRNAYETETERIENASRTQGGTDKNDNNGKNENNNNIYDESFKHFWESYPKKVNKQSALKAWKKLKPDVKLIEIIILDIKNKKDSEDWTKDNGQFCPHPSSYLNGKRWEDEDSLINNKKKYDVCY